eukprot:scaffold25040_cov21-Tisochrysis_lutea.AAC.1
MVSKALRLNVLNRHPQIPKKMLERLQEACRQARRLARTSPRRRTWRQIHMMRKNYNDVCIRNKVLKYYFMLLSL